MNIYNMYYTCKYIYIYNIYIYNIYIFMGGNVDCRKRL